MIALCKAAPSIRNGQNAQRLVHQLSPYILEAHAQPFAPSPYFRNIEPSPTEALAFHTTAALLVLGNNYEDLEGKVVESTHGFLNACKAAVDKIVIHQTEGVEGADVDDAVRTATIALALLGFIDAASAQADFWRVGGRLNLVQRIRDILSGSFLLAVEKAFSTLRNMHTGDWAVKEWRHHLRHYSVTGRPLSAMLLQRSFSWLLVSVTSLLVIDASHLRQSHVLDLLASGEGRLRPMSSKSSELDFRSVETYASIVTSQMTYLEATSDFNNQVASSWQQKMSFAIKASSLTSYLICSILNEEAADADILMAWLEDVIADPVQMADEVLATVVLKGMALISKASPAFSASISRLLPRFIVQSASHSGIVMTASNSLASVLRMLSKDSVITTMYTLGNVLSPSPPHEAIDGDNSAPGVDTTAIPIYSGRHSTGSSISVQLNGDGDTTVVYGNVVHAICGIAEASQDEKITALAQSMLLQKIGKVNSVVDAQIIRGAAALSLKGGQLEFRALLKMFARICRAAVADRQEQILVAVSIFFPLELENLFSFASR